MVNLLLYVLIGEGVNEERTADFRTVNGIQLGEGQKTLRELIDRSNIQRVKNTWRQNF